MASFWDAKDKIPVRQTKVAIQAEHGLDYTAGQKITIIIPPTVQYFQPKESYLKFDLKLSQGATEPMRVQLDSDAGAQMLIKDIRIMSGGAGAQLLEEYQDYNVLATLRYDYETDATLRNRRALTEGTTGYDQTTRGTRGTSKSRQSGLAHNPYYNPYAVGTTPDSTADGGVWGGGAGSGDVPAGAGARGDGNKSVKCLLPIHTGIFQNNKVFPSLLTEGLRVEILLEDANRVVKCLDSTNKNNRRFLGPILHSVGAVEGGKDDYQGIGTKGEWDTLAAVGIDVTDTFWFKRTNNQLGIENFPLVVGESFNLMGQAAANGALTDPENYHGLQGFPNFTTADGTNKLVIKEIVWVPPVAVPTGTTQGGHFGLIKVTTVSAATIVAGAGATGYDAISGGLPGVVGSGGWVAISTAGASSAALGATWPSPTPAYTLSNVELILQQLEMPAGYTRKMTSMMKAGGSLNYDFLSATNYKYSQLAGDIVANIRLPLSQSRAKAILSVPTDSTRYSNRAYMSGTNSTDGCQGSQSMWSTPYVPAEYTYLEQPANFNAGSGTNNSDSWGTPTAQDSNGFIETNDGQMYSTRSGMVGIWDYLTNYQWFYNGQLNPNRAVDVSKISNKQSISQQQLIELEKALAMSGIRPLSFEKFNKSAVIGRALSLQDGVYDTRGKDFNLQVNYEGTAPEKNKLWMNYVHHIRRLQVKGDQISLQI